MTTDSEDELDQYEETPLWDRIVDINNARLDLEEETEAWMEDRRAQLGLTAYDDTAIRQLKSIFAVSSSEDIASNALFLHTATMRENYRLHGERLRDLARKTTELVCSLTPRAKCSPEAEERYQAMVISTMLQDALYPTTPNHYCGNCHYQAQVAQWFMQRSCTRRNRDNDPPATPDHLYHGNTEDDTEKAPQDTPNNA
ncbi:hypothetical protein BJV82DRAFT_675328 [Fennellomyces sp. T-0311]|nr:hypothetical protein BJV82DRAFT_675328 [Fennellomyces sp. T-0311]